MTNLQRLQNVPLRRSRLSKLGLRVLFVIVASAQFPLPISHAHELGQPDSELYSNSLMPAGLTDHLDRYHGNQCWLPKPATESEIYWHVHFLMPWQLGIDCSRALVDADIQTTDASNTGSNGFAPWLGYCDLTSQDQDVPMALDFIAQAVFVASLDPPLLLDRPHVLPAADFATSYLGSFASVSPHALLCVLRC